MSPEIGVMFQGELLLDYARRAEAAGFAQLWVVEDCFFMGGISQVAIALAAIRGGSCPGRAGVQWRGRVPLPLRCRLGRRGERPVQ